MWTNIHAPQNIKDFVGNASAVKKIQEYIFKFDPDKPNTQKMLLLIGNAGLGKTTIVNVVGKTYGYTVSEFNASDTRSPAMVKELLFDNYTLDSYFKDGGKLAKKNHLVLMDEIDGMQPAGITELLKLTETAKCPIICVCNVETPAVQKLAKFVDKVRFYPVSTQDIKRRIGVILKKEGNSLDLSETDLTDIIESNDGDIRKTINQIQWLCIIPKKKRKKIDDETNDTSDQIPQIHTDTIFNMVKTLINSKASLDEALEYYNDDSQMIPLFIQENYLLALSSKLPPEADFSQASLKAMETISESISLGDTVNTDIYSNQSFELIPFHGILSTSVPVQNMKGQLERISFPSLLGKSSSLSSKITKSNQMTDKMSKCIGHIERELTTGPIRLNHLALILYYHLTNGDDNSVQKVITLLKLYGLNADDFKELFILTGKDDLFSGIDKKKKLAITKGFK